MRLKLAMAAIPLLIAASGAFAAEKDRIFVESRWYELGDIKGLMKHYDPKEFNWVFPSNRLYILGNQSAHTSKLPPVTLDERNKRIGVIKTYSQKPGDGKNLSAELDKSCLMAFKVALVNIGGRSAGLGPAKSQSYEVVGIQSQVMAKAPSDIYHSQKREIITQKPPTSDALLCSVYRTPKKDGRIVYNTMVVLTAKAAYGAGKW